MLRRPAHRLSGRRIGWEEHFDRHLRERYVHWHAEHGGGTEEGQQSERQFRTSNRIERSGFLRPAVPKMSMTASDATAREMIYRMACSSSSPVLRSPATLLASTARTARNSPTSSRIRSASACGTPRENACASRLNDLAKPYLSVDIDDIQG